MRMIHSPLTGRIDEAEHIFRDALVTAPIEFPFVISISSDFLFTRIYAATPFTVRRLWSQPRSFAQLHALTTDRASIQPRRA